VGNNEGNALGRGFEQKEALKGRDNFPKRPPRSVRSFEVLRSHLPNDLPAMKGFVAPLQGLVVSSRRDPRALPWAGLLQPVPGEDSVLRRPRHQDEQHPFIDSFKFGARMNRMNRFWNARTALESLPFCSRRRSIARAPRSMRFYRHGPGTKTTGRKARNSRENGGFRRLPKEN